MDTARVRGVDPDLRVRPFFYHGGTISIREFIVGALHAEMGLQVADPDLARAAAGERVTTPAGMVLDGALDTIEGPPKGRGELSPSLVDFLEFYLLNYFKPGRYERTDGTRLGRRAFMEIGCARCHVTNLRLERDRRVADLHTVFDPERGILNGLYATARPLLDVVEDSAGWPALKRPRLGSFVVKDIFTDFKRHDLGPAFHERNYDGTIRTHFLTTPLWGVGSTAPYGHDGRSINLMEVILRHGGAAQGERNAFAGLAPDRRAALLELLGSLVIFPPDDTASNLDPGNPGAPGFPQFGHGSVKLGVLFNDPSDRE
ncbi:MAG: hypothetical protein L0027_03345 [Candidatus Rokubacteria bacterium]|nr:hypothetical protein [Candidatus Rokubacteria bacterium]